MDRLGAWEYWKSGVDGANAFVLFRACRDQIDEKRLRDRASEEGFQKALDALRRFDEEWARENPDAAALEDWANRGPGTEDE